MAKVIYPAPTTGNVYAGIISDLRRVLDNTASALAVRAGARNDVNAQIVAFTLATGLGGIPTFGAIGDSQTDQNSRFIEPPLATPSSAWFSDGPLAEFRSQSGQAIFFPLENEKGVSADTLQMMLARAPASIQVKYKPHVMVVMGGANNMPTADTLETMIAVWKELVTFYRNQGITVVVLPVPPRAAGVLTQPQIDKQIAFNNFLREYCALNTGFFFIDYLAYVTDPATVYTTNQPLANMVKADNLHPANGMAYWIGRAMVEQLGSFLPPYIPLYTTAADAYSPTNYSGSLLRNGSVSYSPMLGTGGTHTPSSGFTSSGDLAPGFTSIKSGGTGTAVVTTSKRARSDGKAGEEQVVQVVFSAAGGADEIISLRATPNINDVLPGEKFYAECYIELVTTPVNIRALELYLLETRPSNSQTAIDGAYNSTLSLLLPPVRTKKILRTPVITRQSDSTALQVNIRVRQDTTSGSSSVTYAITDYAVRKVR